jgi:hypothetical protein
MDTQNPPKAPVRRDEFGCSCVKSNDEPPPPPTTLPDVTWDVDKTLPQQAQEAINAKNFEWDKEFNSPYGVVHMAGNAAEWVSDYYDAQYYRVSPIQNPRGPDSGDSHVFRGGSYLSDSSQLATYWRGFCMSSRRDASYARPAIGIRCAKSLELIDTMKPEELQSLKPNPDEPSKPKPEEVKKPRPKVKKSEDVSDNTSFPIDMSNVVGVRVVISSRTERVVRPSLVFSPPPYGDHYFQGRWVVGDPYMDKVVKEYGREVKFTVNNTSKVAKMVSVSAGAEEKSISLQPGETRVDKILAGKDPDQQLVVTVDGKTKEFSIHR